MHEAHPILDAALQRIEKSLWPAEIHLGAAPPQVTYRAVVDVTVRLLDLVCSLGAGDDLQKAAEVCRAVCDAETPAARYTSMTYLWDYGMHRELAGPHQWPDLSGEPLLTARSFWLVSRDTLPSSPEIIEGDSESVLWWIGNLELVLKWYAVTAARRTELLQQIDTALLVDEARRILALHSARTDVCAVLWRQPSETGVHLLCELSNAEYCVVTELSDRWQVEVGPLDDVLSVLPEELFPLATQRAFDR